MLIRHQTVGVLIAFACLLALFASYDPTRPRTSAVSKLEKTCAYEGNFVPCFIRDEALQQQWSV